MTNDRKYDIFFNIEERGHNGRYKVLIDADGYICGVFGTYRAAKEAMSRIRRKLVKAFRERDSGKGFDSEQTNIVTGIIGTA